MSRWREEGGERSLAVRLRRKDGQQAVERLEERTGEGEGEGKGEGEGEG